MNSDHRTPDTTPAAPPAAADAQQARLALLFRGALREGRIHPLQHLIQRHWAERAQPPANVPQGGAR